MYIIIKTKYSTDKVNNDLLKQSVVRLKNKIENACFNYLSRIHQGTI